MAEKRVIEIEVKENFKQVEKDLDNLNESLKDTVENNRDVSKSFSDVYGELQPLTTRMGEAEDRLYELAAAGQTTTQEYKDLLNTVAGYRKVQMQTDMVVDAASTTMSTKMTNAIGGVSNAFSLAEGATALMGVESEQLQETMVKLQAAMAISQGIQGLKEGGLAFKQLGQSAMTALKGIKSGLAATGIGLLIIAVGLLVTNFDKLKNSFNSNLSSAKKFAESTEKQAELARQALENFDEYERTLKRLGYTEEEIVNKREKAYKKAIKQSKEQYDAQVALLKESEKSFKKVETWDKLGLNFTGRLLYGDEEDVKANRDKAIQIKKDLVKIKNDQAEFNAEQKAKRKQIADEEEQERKDRLQKIKDKADEELAQIKEFYKQAKESNASRLRTDQENEEYAINEKYNAQIKLAKKYKKDTTELELAQANEINEIRLKYQNEQYAKDQEIRQKELDAIKESNRLKIEAEQELQAEIEDIDESNFQVRLQKSMTEQEYELELVRQKYFTLEEAAKGNAEQLAIIEEAKNNELSEINIKYADAELELKKRNRDFAIESAVSMMSTITELAAQSQAKYEALNKAVLDNDKLTDSEKQKLLDANNKKAKKAFDIQKAANVASALITTYQSATSAYASQFVPVPDPSSPIRGGIAAGLAVAAGLANVKRIASQKFEGASLSGSSSSGGGGSVPDAGTINSPNFSVIGSSGVNQLAQLQQQPTKAYVVSGEVTSQQALDRNRVQNATL